MKYKNSVRKLVINELIRISDKNVYILRTKAQINYYIEWINHLKSFLGISKKKKNIDASRTLTLFLKKV